MTKISQYTAITTLASGDLLDISQDAGGGSFDTKSIDYDDILIQLFGTATPHPSAIIELVSTSKGFIPPKMTTAQRTAITGVAGLMVYDTTLNQWFGYDGSGWVVIG